MVISFFRTVYYFLVNLYLHLRINAKRRIKLVVPYVSKGGIKNIKNRIKVEEIRQKHPLYLRHIPSHVIFEKGSTIRGGILELGQGAQIYLAENSNFDFGDIFSVGDFSIVRVSSEGKLEVRDNFHAMNFFRLSCEAKMRIGTNFLASDFIILRDGDGHPIEFNDKSKNEPRPVSIGNNVWVGIGSYILKGATIEDNAIIGANTLVTKKVLKNTIVAGNPARRIKTIKSWSRFIE